MYPCQKCMLCVFSLFLSISGKNAHVSFRTHWLYLLAEKINKNKMNKLLIFAFVPVSLIFRTGQ